MPVADLSTRPRIATLVAEPARMARLKAAFGEDCVLAFDSVPRLLAASRGESVALVIVPARDRTGGSLVSVVAAIRASRRSPPVYVYAARDEHEIRELMPLGRAGSRGLILVGAGDDPASLRRLLETDTLAWAVENVRRGAEQVLSPRHLPLVLCCLEHITDPPRAGVVARRLKVSPRTLSSWASQAGARGIRSLTSKCRVLVAIEMLRHSRRSIEQVALALGFGSSAHLHNTITRYAGVRPREAAAGDTLRWCRRFFAHAPATVTAAPSTPVRPAKSVLRPAEWPPVPNAVTLPPTNQAMP